MMADTTYEIKLRVDENHGFVDIVVLCAGIPEAEDRAHSVEELKKKLSALAEWIYDY